MADLFHVHHWHTNRGPDEWAIIMTDDPQDTSSGIVVYVFRGRRRFRIFGEIESRQSLAEDLCARLNKAADRWYAP